MVDVDGDCFPCEVDLSAGHDHDIDLEAKDSKEYAVGWWPEGNLTICLLKCDECDIDDRNEFYEILKSSMPHGTQIFGYVRKSEKSGNLYSAVLGFPFRIGSWQGVDDHFRLTLKDGMPVSRHVYIRFSNRRESLHRVLCEMLSLLQDLDVTFGEPLKVVLTQDKHEQELPPFVETAGEMWTWTTGEDENGNNGLERKRERRVMLCELFEFLRWIFRF